MEPLWSYKPLKSANHNPQQEQEQHCEVSMELYPLHDVTNKN